MKKEIKKCRLNGEITAISSKSYAHRMMICAFLSDDEVVVEGVSHSADIEATLNVLRSFGGEFEVNGDRIVFHGRKKSEKAIADCNESGSTLRFCLPLAGALGIETQFVGSNRLLERPNELYIECLEKHGVSINNYHLTGKLQAGIYEIDSSISSQYITGLLLSLPLLEGDSELILIGKSVSKGYIDITVDVLNIAGITVKKITENHYKILGGQKYKMQSCRVPGDWSNSAFFLVAGAVLGDRITIKGLLKDSQTDCNIVEILRKYGAEVEFCDNKITVKKWNNNPITADMENCPDLAPIVSVLCAYSEGVSELYNVDRLKIKECDRLTAIMENLKKAGVKTEYKNNVLKIYGKGEITKADYIGYNDHRMVMSATVLCGISGGTVDGVEAVNKSYPNFFDDFIKVGGIVE